MTLQLVNEIKNQIFYIQTLNAYKNPKLTNHQMIEFVFGGLIWIKPYYFLRYAWKSAKLFS